MLKTLEKKFIHNDCNVVMNANVIFYSMKPKALAWDYWKIETGICVNGLWDYGLKHSSGRGPVSHGQFQTEKEAILKAIEQMNFFFERALQGHHCTSIDTIEYNQDKFFQFVERYQSENLDVSLNNILKKEIQLTLF